MSAALGFTGARAIAIVKALTGAALSFTGALATRTARLVALAGAVLSFTGTRISGKQFVRALTATLSFTGVLLPVSSC